MPTESIEQVIYFVRGYKVILDRDLAALYGVETRVLVQAAKRNLERFPRDFMFQMTKEELENWRSQFVTSKNKNEFKGLTEKENLISQIVISSWGRLPRVVGSLLT